MVLLAKNYHYIEFSEPKKKKSVLFFLAGPGSGRPAPGPGSRAGPGNIEKHGKKKNWPARPAGPESGISVLRVLLSPSKPLVSAWASFWAPSEQSGLRQEFVRTPSGLRQDSVRSPSGMCSEYRNTRMPEYQMAGPAAGDPAPGLAAGTGRGSRAGPG